MSKIKILWLSDCTATNNSGFAKVSYELLTRLHATDLFMLAELGINNPKGEGYKFEPPWKMYLSGTKQHCEDVFVDAVRDFQPDVVIVLLDIHMYAYINDPTQVPIEVRNSFKLIAHNPVDGAPMDTYGLNVAAGCNSIACIHDYGKPVLQEGWARLIQKLKQEVRELLKLQMNSDEETGKQIDQLINFKVMQANNYARINQNTVVINHGVDLSVFKPVTPEVKSQYRKEFGIRDDEFVFVYFGRNSPRKQQPLVIQAFKEVLKKYPNSRLILGCKVVDCGWNLMDIIDQCGVDPKKIMFTNNDSARAAEGLTNEGVAQIYQMSDCHVSAAVGGGFELCCAESMACGLPQIGIKGAGSITKMVDGHGILVPAKEYYLGGSFGPHARPVPTVHDFANAMKEMVGSKKKAEWSMSAIGFSRRLEYNWDFAASEFVKLIEKTMLDDSVAVEGVSNV